MEFSVFSDEHFMNQALREAEIAEAEGEIPIGAIVVCQRKIIAKSHNMTEKLQDVTAHAEIIALGSASEYLGSKYLDQCKLVVTMEPCAMCAGALAWAQVAELVYGA
ncbi:MAG: tRNA-specific adenosine deaminase, partial [Bacteroidetes bacterium SW_10_40_5]